MKSSPDFLAEQTEKGGYRGYPHPPIAVYTGSQRPRFGQRRPKKMDQPFLDAVLTNVARLDPTGATPRRDRRWDGASSSSSRTNHQQLVSPSPRCPPSTTKRYDDDLK